MVAATPPTIALPRRIDVRQAWLIGLKSDLLRNIFMMMILRSLFDGTKVLQILLERYFQSLSITAALLPSLQAQYKMEHVHSGGVTGHKAHFTVDLPTHSLSFVTKLQVKIGRV